MRPHRPVRLVPWLTALTLTGALAAACSGVDRVGIGADGEEEEETGATSGDTSNPSSCGDDACTDGETCESCAPDCCAAACGDGLCEAGEDCETCLEDCGGCPSCGDRVCAQDETCATCAVDCGECPGSCSDGLCDASESCTNCPEDCGECSATCGDGSCDSGGGETCSSCAADCGSCPPMCGDAKCDPGENCVSCEGDCGMCPPSCGNGTCNINEDCATCAQDCGACACMADAEEPNNGSPSAAPVADGSLTCNLSVCTGDVDWYQFVVTSGFNVEITFLDSEGDLEIEIYSKATLGYVTGSYGDDDFETVTKTGIAAGTYWARVYEASGGENPDYCLSVDTF